jgi:hypothetical protein
MISAKALAARAITMAIHFLTQPVSARLSGR